MAAILTRTFSIVDKIKSKMEVPLLKKDMVPYVENKKPRVKWCDSTWHFVGKVSRMLLKILAQLYILGLLQVSVAQVPRAERTVTKTRRVIKVVTTVLGSLPTVHRTIDISAGEETTATGDVLIKTTVGYDCESLESLDPNISVVRVSLA